MPGSDGAETASTASLAALLHAIGKMTGDRGRQMTSGLAGVAAAVGEDGSDAPLPELVAWFENRGDETRAADLARALQARAADDEAFGTELASWRAQPEIQALERHLTRLASLSAGPAPAPDKVAKREIARLPATVAQAPEPASSHPEPAASVPAVPVPRPAAPPAEESAAPKHSRLRGFGSSLWTITIVGGVVVGVILLIITTAFQSSGDRSPKGAVGTTNPAAHSGTAADSSTLQARIEWCCQLASVAGSDGYIWPESYKSLRATVKAGSLDLAHISRAGIGQLEISLQTNNTEPIYVAPPEVIVQDRARRPGRGLYLVVNNTPQGAGETSQFIANLDDRDPVTVPYSPKSSQQSAGGQTKQYFYVSRNSTEIMILQVVDRDFLCRFSILIRWRSGGRDYQHLFSNDGKPFTIAGSGSLRSIVYNPIVGTLKDSPASAG